MKKSIIVVVLSLTLLASPVLAKPADSVKSFKLPDNAVEIAPNVFSLGTTYDKQSHSMVEGYAFVHKKNDVKLNALKGPKAPSCYGFLADGAKWKNVENWTVFPGAGLDGNFILDNTASNISKWEDAADGIVGNGSEVNILGAGSIDTGTPGDPNVFDEKNEVSFASISNNSTIAVTIVWGYFGGRTSNRVLVAWDQIYNSDYSWSATGEADKMDFENISTHELGHSVGMNDIYNSSCSAVTMYGYANFGETNKTTLEPADIKGISTLY